MAEERIGEHFMVREVTDNCWTQTLPLPGSIAKAVLASQTIESLSLRYFEGGRHLCHSQGGSFSPCWLTFPPDSPLECSGAQLSCQDTEQTEKALSFHWVLEDAPRLSFFFTT